MKAMHLFLATGDVTKCYYMDSPEPTVRVTRLVESFGGPEAATEMFVGFWERQSVPYSVDYSVSNVEVAETTHF